MAWFLIGLIGFLAVHSVRIVAPDWRVAQIARMGEGPWKGLYSVVVLMFFVVMVWGFGQARQTPTLLWQPPFALRHVAHGLLLPAFVLLAAAYVPRNAIRVRLRHPMLLGTILWAAAHLLVSGWMHSVLLFGAFLLWAVLDLVSAWRRPDAPSSASVSPLLTGLSIVIGVGLYAAVVFRLHLLLIGRAPM